MPHFPRSLSEHCRLGQPLLQHLLRLVDSEGHLLPPIPAAPGDESKGGLSLEQGKCEMQPAHHKAGHNVSAGTAALRCSPLAVLQRQSYVEIHCELVQVCVPLCIHKFFQILQKLRVPPPTQCMK